MSEPPLAGVKAGWWKPLTIEKIGLLPLALSAAATCGRNRSMIAA